MAVVDGPNRSAILSEIEARRREAGQEGQHFTPPPDQPFSKGAEGICIIWQAWNRTVSPSRTLVYSVGIANPTPKTQSSIFAHVFVGTGLVDGAIEPNVRATLGAVDMQFPRLTTPRFAGITLKPGAMASLGFGLKVPPDVEPSNYVGNCLLLQPVWHAPQGHVDRSIFIFEVAHRLL